MNNVYMNNVYISEISEFRRFVNKYIYPTTINLLIDNITYSCDTIEIEYESLPRAIIKFRSNIASTNNSSNYMTAVHNILKNIFVEYFNNPEISGMIKNKIHTEIQNDDLKNSLRNALQEIQLGDQCYLGLLFNLVMLKEQTFYVHL